jgi:hypothetical protein
VRRFEMLNAQQLKRLMHHYAEVIGNKTVNDDKPLESYLPEGGFGTATPQRIFKSFVKYVLHNNGNAIKKWPDDWPSTSINELAPRLL